jgi:protein-S-isoprenylcysteine O-methyltransferase Ste14
MDALLLKKTWSVPVYEAAMRVPLAACAGYLLWREWQGLAGARNALAMTVSAASMVFLALVAAMTLVRRRAVRKSDGWLPRLAALAGVGLLFALMLLPRAEADPAWQSASLALLLAGQFVCVVALLELGRSLSVMPEARRLVSGGVLYARIRHPVYLGEAIAALGMLLQYRSAFAFALVAAQYGCQLWRMREEEKVLRQAFPEYAEYCARTARLIPGVY